MSLSENIAAVRAAIAAAEREAGRAPGSVTLCAATKTQSSETIRAAIAAGVTVCGENRVQELTAHLEDFAYDGAAVHFIGHLQTNKVRFVVGRVDLIESVSSLKLLEAIEARAAKLDLVQDILLEVNIGGEESKSGFPPEEVPQAAQKAAALPHVRLRGLMAIPPAAACPGSTRPWFQKMKKLFVDIGGGLEDNRLDILSMGMSADYPDAVAEGATLVRVGTALFGPRQRPLAPPCMKEKGVSCHEYP